MPIIGQYSDYLNASNGIGEAVRANVVVNRDIGNSQINVDTVLNWPPKFVATVGTLNATTGIFTPGTVTVFFGHLSGSYIIIDEFSPGYADIGNTANQIVVIKPATSWADKVSAAIGNAMKAAIYDVAGIAQQVVGVVAAQLIQNKTFDSTSPTAFMYPGFLMPFSGRTAPNGWLNTDGSSVSRTTYANLFAALNAPLSGVTMTIATPAVVTKTAHGLSTGDQIFFTTTGALPTGLVANTLYFAIRVDANTFNVSTTRANAYAGTKIATTGSQSGVHTAYDSPYGIADGTTFLLPDARGRALAAMDINGGTAAGRLSLANSQGVYGNLGANGGAQSHTLVIGETPSHGVVLSHHGDEGGSIVRQFTAINGTSGAIAYPGAYRAPPGATGGASSIQSPSASWGSDQSHNNTQPTLLVNYVIKT